MTQKIIQRNHVHPSFRIALLFILIICGTLLLASTVWIYHKIHYSIGLEFAEVSVALISVLILVLILVGLRTGLDVDRFIRQRHALAWKLYQSSSQVRYLLRLLGYEEIEPELGGTPEATDLAQLATSLSNTTPRRGRPPTYSLERWTRVVLAWENRDVVRNPMTLAEFLCEHFGENADGSPHISENCFYTNRKKVLDEIQKEIAARKDEMA